MSENEAILYLAIGFMIIIGIWLAALTYLVLKRHKVQMDQGKSGSATIEEKIPEEEKVEEPAADGEPDEDETSEEEKEKE